MDGKNRAASSYLSPGNPPADKEQNDPLAQVFHNACSYNFFAMAELLHRLAKGEKGTPELSLRDDPAQETLRFSADASLAFPCSDISALKRDTSGAFRMTTTFMGLQGSQSPLPGYYLDHLAWKAVHEQSPVGDFLDMFSHRLTQFVWHIWRKYRYHISFRNGGVRPSAPLSDPASNGGINTPFMDLPPIYASPGDRNDDVSAAEMAQRHLAVTPLLRGLGGSLTMSNSDDADDFLEEAGRTLQAAIKGLLDLQQQRNSLSDKHLRPLEDNPLRLNMDYATALDVMFAEGKSPVHLAAPAAVSESLRNVRHHEEANRAAIVESLRVLLDAFSPQNLLRRFVQYRRSHELRQPLDDAGAWQMYSHYYEELASDRQQGFEMLFNEVYAQVYDRVLREKQREPEA